MSDGAEPAPFRSVWTRSADSLRLHARDYGAADGRLPVVCLPGLTRNAAEFDRLATALLARGAAGRIVAVDYRGRGRSEHDPDPSHYTIPVETGDLLGMLAELGIERASFVGVSRGGLISMGLATVKPELVAAVVLNDIGPVVDRPGLLRIKGYVGKLGSPRSLPDAVAQMRARFGEGFPALDRDDWEHWAETIWVQDGHGALVADYDPALSRALDEVDETSPIPDIWKVFEAIGPIPLMVVWGTNSDLLSRDTIDGMRRRRPDLEVVEVPGEAHTPMLYRPAIVDRIAALLARAEAAAPRP